MMAVTWSEVSFKQVSLPKLRIAQEESKRRDSLSSARTGDSGYNSDPDISLSPLDFVSPDQLPHTSSDFTFDSSALFDVKESVSSRTNRPVENACNLILFKKHKGTHKPLPAPRIEVTSNPTDTPVINKPDWTNAFKKSAQDPPKERNSSIVSLSSTGSCDMFSNIEDNSEDEDVLDITPSTLSKATLKTIELIMRKIEANLGYAAYMQCAGSQSRAQGSTSSASKGAGRGTSQGSGGKRKSRLDEHLPPDDPDEDGSNKRRRVSITTTTEDSETGPRFACPFYKHDPNRYRNRRTCPGPGWPTVHRMKEHLYRSHAQPIYCPRCYAMFDSDGDFSNHLRAHPCQISAPQPIEGIDRETLKSLRKRSPALRLEENKWTDTYQLLFPDVSAADVPSPYYDSDSPTEESRRFRRELLERIRQELFTIAEHEPGPVEQRLLRQVAGIIQRCENDLLTSFCPTNTPRHLHPSLPTSRRASAIAATFDDRHSAVHPPSGPPSAPPTIPIFPPPQIETMSPRSTHVDGELPHVAESQNQNPSITYPDPFHFSSNDWIDWNVVFPPGSEGNGSERGEGFPTLTMPVWT